VPAPRLITLSSTDHDRRRIIPRWLAIQQALVAACWIAADDTDRLELVHHLRDRHQLPHRAERLPPKIRISAREDHPNAPAGEQGGDVHDLRIQELCLVDRHDLDVGPDQPKDLGGRVYRAGLELGAIVTRDAVEAGVAAVEMRLEHLHLTPGYGRPPDTADQLLALPAEHDAADHLDPSGVHPVIHRRLSDSVGIC
jgi:hypothetical protein